MVTTEQALRQAIVKHPADDVPRLLYADWLEDRDKPGDHAKAQEIRRMIETKEQVSSLHFCRLHEITYTLDVTIERGFISAIRCTMEDWKSLGQSLMQEYPITYVSIDLEPFKNAMAINWREYLLEQFYRQFVGAKLHIEQDWDDKTIRERLSDALLAWGRYRIAQQEVAEQVQRLRAAGADAWDVIDDPEKYLE